MSESECNDRMRCKSFELKEVKFRLDISRKYSTMRMLTSIPLIWNRFCRDIVDVPFLGVFKTRLDGVLSKLV